MGCFHGRAIGDCVACRLVELPEFDDGAPIVRSVVDLYERLGAAEAFASVAVKDLVKAAVDFAQNARGGYGGNVWRDTHIGRTLIDAVAATGLSTCAGCEALLAKEDTRQEYGSDPFCSDCWLKHHPESDE